ncbi:THUMP-like domain-containing protein [Salegentibacter sp. HM20]
MNKAILNPEIQNFIRKNLKTELTSLVLKGSPFPEVTAAELAQQISALKKAEKKLPSWFAQKNLYYPPKLNLEQTSSEATAKYKASLFKAKRTADLTGGLGVDSYYFAQNSKEHHYCELNKDLCEIAAHNFEVLNQINIKVHCGDGLEFLKNSPLKFDFIYLDPARRDDAGGKLFKLADCLPDVPQNLALLFSKTEKILLKTSPLLDLRAGLQELQQVSEIHIVAVENEVKELLWLLEKDFSDSPQIHTVNFKKKGDQYFSGNIGVEFQAEYSLPKKYLFEPNAALMKSGIFDELAQQTGTLKLHQNSHLFTSDKSIDFPGRVFQISDILQFKPSEIKKKFKSKKAHVATRNFPLSVAEIRKKFSIKDGGDSYLFFTTNLEGNLIVLSCKKLT